jgi:amidohydrolase
MHDYATRAAELFPEMTAHRRHLHQHPELSFQEFETAAYLRAQLNALGIQHRAVANTGIVATIGAGARCVGLRADIDALPIEEETGLPYRSSVPGVMHACGHDTHMTMLLTAARMLKEQESSLPGTVVVLFQPGEEKVPGGASIMIKEGALADPAPEAIFGQHIDPDAPAGTVSFVAGPMMASADELYWTIHGTGAHAAQPHKGNDPVQAAAGLIQHLQTLITKRRDPLDAGVITVTSIHGGSATNIIPEVVELKGTLRSFSNTWREFAWSWIEEQSKAYCALYGCTCEFTIVKGYPPLVNDAIAVDHARMIAERTFGTERVQDFEPKMWAEDFSFYSQMMPAAFWMLGGRPHDQSHMPGLHHPRFAPDEQAMITGSALLASAAHGWLERQANKA